jgi:hypothetical protein
MKFENYGGENERRGRKLLSHFHFSLSLIKATRSRTARWAWHVKRLKVRKGCKVVVATLKGKSPSEKSVIKLIFKKYYSFFKKKLSISCISDHCVRLLKPTKCTISCTQTVETLLQHVSVEICHPLEVHVPRLKVATNGEILFTKFHNLQLIPVVYKNICAV